MLRFGFSRFHLCLNWLIHVYLNCDDVATSVRKIFWSDIKRSFLRKTFVHKKQTRFDILNSFPKSFFTVVRCWIIDRFTEMKLLVLIPQLKCLNMDFVLLFIFANPEVFWWFIFFMMTMILILHVCPRLWEQSGMISISPSEKRHLV